MNEIDAAAAFDHLLEEVDRRGLSGIAAALAELDRRQVGPIDAGALVHYAATEQVPLVLVDQIHDLAVAAVAAAAAAAVFSGEAAANEQGTLRRHFQDAVISLAPSMAGASEPGRTRELVGKLATRLGIARAMLERAAEDRVDAWMAVRDFLDAAAVAALLEAR